MLSVLIPIYNYNAHPLVQEFHKQCTECGIDFEIICVDDASTQFKSHNNSISSLSNCSFTVLPQNIGRSKIRNLLAAKSNFEWLLFIDCDSIILNENYITKYILNLEGFDILYGGRLHPEKCPSNSQQLRWKYGRLIEDQTASNRKQRPFKSLLFNNTLIKKNCFDQVKFNEEICTYGHEDSLLSYQLSTFKFKVNHIENPLQHTNIDTNEVFLNKTKDALENLLNLYRLNQIDIKFIRMVKLYHFLNKTKLSFPISKLFSVFENLLLKNLKGKKPSLFIFNIFRVGYICK
ncbi:glycosyltransferase family 2 protein [Flavobacterium frigoris]|uniref:B-glycosyltransferase-related protein n=1 Tax=Flavobacterium frigoris (strain PS1) TaxID=1086011 RepID=H7FRJ9_FLAFP|nr:glycosyltransferase [Flavobacterium frigoris]EIA08982.1 b-glycosyltransferase-related protein [Flavobacterium frigoris PS1]